MNILYATIHQRTNQGDEAKEAPITFVSKSVKGLINQIKDQMVECDYEDAASSESIAMFNGAADLQTMEAWFEHHYCYFDLAYGSMVVAD